MTPEQLIALQESERPKPIIPSNFKEGTLLYGYTSSRNSFHVYNEGNQFHVVIYSLKSLVSYNVYDEGEGHEFNPGKRIYANCTDFDFALALIHQGNLSLSFANGDSVKTVDELPRYKDFSEYLLADESRSVIRSEFFYLFEEFVKSGNEILDAFFKLDSLQGKIEYVTDIDGNTLPITDFMTFITDVEKTKHKDLGGCSSWCMYINALIINTLNAANQNYSRPLGSDIQVPVINIDEQQFSSALESTLEEHKQHFDVSAHGELIKAKNMAQERLSPFIFGKLDSIKPKTKEHE
ncbi:hypothetical protein LMH73_008725 [Vibrio splendidus]|nr:hypothetical protein [Vibrio splendidus]MCC4879449.1 hypothetical protein [Vibrio splendidus]